MKKLCCIVGARPNFMKIAPIMRAFGEDANTITPILVHTGQHYDESMNGTFFKQLDIPAPDIHLNVGSNSHAMQTADIMKRFEPVIQSENPDAILVVGDVNSTIACALVAAKSNVRIIHVEAGLRSFDRKMPEEINRILTDQLSDLLFTTERNAEINLLNENVSPEKIQFVGNVMIDNLFHNLKKTSEVNEIIARNKINIDPVKGYGLVTLHRPSNVDDSGVLRQLLETLSEISRRLPLIFPVHPRTAKKIEDYGLNSLLESDNLISTPPLPYLDLLGLMSKCKMVLTDSGGIQEETTALGIPCLTLRENTERPITLTEGTNTLVGTDRNKILEVSDEILLNGKCAGRVPELWDGHAAIRIASKLKNWL